MILFRMLQGLPLGIQIAMIVSYVLWLASVGTITWLAVVVIKELKRTK